MSGIAIFLQNLMEFYLFVINFSMSAGLHEFESEHFVDERFKDPMKLFIDAVLDYSLLKY